MYSGSNFDVMYVCICSKMRSTIGWEIFSFISEALNWLDKDEIKTTTRIQINKLMQFILLYSKYSGGGSVWSFTALLTMFQI